MFALLVLLFKFVGEVFANRYFQLKIAGEVFAIGSIGEEVTGEMFGNSFFLLKVLGEVFAAYIFNIKSPAKCSLLFFFAIYCLANGSPANFSSR